MYAKGDGIIARDDTKAAEWFTKAANQGHASAQYGLGVIYIKGEGVAQDYMKAFEWFTKAANQGHALAKYNLGLMYDIGQGVEKNKRKAFEWVKEAVQGVPIAQK